MADLLSVGLSGLMANQTALDVTSQNITNVGTPGYNEQTAEFVTTPAEQSGNGWLGTGVNVQTITRAYNDLLTQQVRSTSTSVSQLTALSNLATQVSSMLGDSTTGISASLSSLSSAMQNVSTQPTSTAARSALLSQAQTFVNQLQSFNTQLNQNSSVINQQVGTEVTAVNTLAQGIASLNSQISYQQAATGQPPNDLLDQRDQLLNQLATHVSITTSMQDNGTVNVVIGNGQSLVVGSQATTLKAAPDPADASRQIITAQTPSGSVNVTASIAGGTLGGLLDSISQVINPALDALGQIGASVAQLVNVQNQSGLDQNGAQGAALFSIGSPNVQNGLQNTGTAALTASIADASALTGANYSLRYGAGGWSMTRTDTGANVPLTGTGTALNPLVANGISIVVAGSPAVGDSFQLLPTRNVIGGLSLLTTDPTKIAAAAALTGAAAGTNTGSGTIGSPTVTSPTNAQLLSTATVTFLTPTTYSVNGSGSFSYTPGGKVTANGWQVQISGAPAAGDTFTVSRNAGAKGDNSNALVMAGILQNPVLQGGTASVQSLASQLVTSTGSVANAAQNNLSAQTVANSDAATALSNATGVNLNQEAANMLRYQQAYQASAEIIKTAGTLFTTLLAAVQGA